ncbi:MAG TPA: cytochrome c biogenesis protein DipZ [Acidimicrobiales bacterium]|nr:cytochrome c biogenesis protein DipZ [Acidimicrobiales bacterium]
MGELLVIAFLGGLITGLSPCIVPVLPVVVAGGSAGTSRARPYLIIAGLVVSFSLAVLVGSTVLSALGLPQNFLMWLGIGLLLALAVGLMIPKVGELLERPFNRLGSTRYADSGGGFVLGLSLGLVFVPCAGPVLAAISAAAGNHRVDASTFLVTIFYAAGATLPLLVFAVLAQRAATGWKKVREHLPVIRRVAGAVLAVTTLAIAFGVLDPLQRAVPGYTAALENRIESNTAIANQLHALSGEKANTLAQKQAAAAKEGTSSLPRLAKAPNFTGIVTWLNTPGDQPLSLAQLKGKVVLIDFWTYSCINCQRSLPHVESWYNEYKKDGLVVVGVHTPEFAFEHVVSNVRSEAGTLGVDYPIAVDNNYGTWDAYSNQYWPAEYLIDPSGEVRAYDFGEGGYGTMESNIRQLLTANGATHLPAPTDVADRTPTNQITQETYLGYSESSPQYFVGTAFDYNKPVDYHAPSSIPLNDLAFSGTWTDRSQQATAGANAALSLHFTADDVYLVLGGSGSVDVSFNGRHLSTVKVSGIPTLYTLFSGQALQTGQLGLQVTPGVQAYDFTFG